MAATASRGSREPADAAAAAPAPGAIRLTLLAPGPATSGSMRVRARSGRLPTRHQDSDAELGGRATLVTGGRRGIDRAVAAGLAAAGAGVAMLARSVSEPDQGTLLTPEQSGQSRIARLRQAPVPRIRTELPFDVGLGLGQC
jgi:hypothetical protein